MRRAPRPTGHARHGRRVPRAGVAGLLIAMLVAAAGCGSTTMTTVAPTPARCDVALSSGSDTLPAAAGTGTLSIATEAECPWRVSSDAAWITRLIPQSGLGSAEVRFDVAANAGPPRSATIDVDGKTLTVNQRSGCTYTIEPTARSFDAGGGTTTVSVTTASSCPWTASSNVPWMAIASGASGTGGGVVRFTVTANLTPARTGTLTVAGETVTVSQASGCTFTVAPSAVSATVAGGPATIAVSTGAGCAWTAQSRAPWIVLASSGQAAGSGEARFTVAANTGAGRSGTVEVAGRTIAVVQASGCTYAVSPTALEFGVIGRQLVAVTTTPGCPWTATPSASWIVILSGQSGTGSGTIDVAVSPFFGTRTGTLAVGGRVVTIRQN